MPHRLMVTAALAAFLSVALPGCAGGRAKTATTSAPAAGPSERSAKVPPSGSVRYLARPVAIADARHCPVTIGHPVPRAKPWRDRLFGWHSAYGNGSLWVGGLWPRGIVFITPGNVDPDGRLEAKFGWYRLTSGFLAISGRRLDAPAPPLSGRTFGYGLTGFNASGVIFPTEGCWQVTGRVGRAALTFVTFVIKGHCNLNAVPIRCIADRAR